MFVWVISHQPTVLFFQNKSAPATGQPSVFFSQNKSTPIRWADQQKIKSILKICINKVSHNKKNHGICTIFWIRWWVKVVVKIQMNYNLEHGSSSISHQRDGHWIVSTFNNELRPLSRSFMSIERTLVTKIIIWMDRKLGDESIKSN
jgi:hypothetical protein